MSSSRTDDDDKKKEEDTVAPGEGAKLLTSVNAALSSLCPPLCSTLQIFGDNLVMTLGIAVALHIAFVYTAPRVLRFLVAYPTCHVYPLIATLSAANRPTDIEEQLLWLCYWGLMVPLELIEQYVFGTVTWNLAYWPVLKMCIALFLTCRTHDWSATPEVSPFVKEDIKDKMKDFSSTVRRHHRYDFLNLITKENKDSSGQPGESEAMRARRKEIEKEFLKAEDEKDKETLEGTVAYPMKYHAVMLLEPLFAARAHCRGPVLQTSRQARVEAQQAARKEASGHSSKKDITFRKKQALDKYFADRSKIPIDPETGREGLGPTHPGNPLINEDGTFKRPKEVLEDDSDSDNAGPSSRPIEKGEKYLRVAPTVGEQTYKPSKWENLLYQGKKEPEGFHDLARQNPDNYPGDDTPEFLSDQYLERDPVWNQPYNQRSAAHLNYSNPSD